MVGPIIGRVPEIRERARQAAVRALHLVDQPMSAGVQEAVRMAAEVCGVPNAVINIFDAETQHPMTTHGLALTPVPRADAMCARTVDSGHETITADARTMPVYADNPFVNGEIARLRFYASLPLTTSTGHVVGTLCTYDEQVHQISDDQVAMLRLLAGQVVELLEIREAMASATRAADELAREAEAVTSILRGSSDAYVGVDADGLVVGWNPAAERVFGRSSREVIGLPARQVLGLEHGRGSGAQGPGDGGADLDDGGALPEGVRIRARRSDGGELVLEASSWPADGGGRHAFVRDVTELAREQAARREAENLLTIAFDHAPHGTAVLGAGGADAGRILQVNPALQRMLFRDDLVGLPLQSLLESSGNQDVLAAFELLATGRIEEFDETASLRSSGGRIYVQAYVALSRDHDGRPWHALAQLRDITREKAYADMLKKQATHDDLTGLANRLLMRQQLLTEIDALRTGNGPLAVMLMDLDRFKGVNDSLGHAAGDDVLVRVAHALRRAAPGASTVCRLGGDEFLVVVPHCDGAAAAELAERVALAVREIASTLPDPVTGKLGVSIGTAFADNPAVVPEELVRAADQSMYQVKRNRTDRTTRAGSPDRAGSQPSFGR